MLITDTRIVCTHDNFNLISERIFDSHIDIVGSLPISNAFSYYLTVVDRYLRRPEVITIVDISAAISHNGTLQRMGWSLRHFCNIYDGWRKQI